MVYEFQKLSEVEALAEVPEEVRILAEVDGDIKRVPGSGLGGGKTLVIITPDFEFAQTMIDQNDSTAWDEFYSSFDTAEKYFGACSTNITFDEAISAFRKGELTSAFCYVITTMPDNNDNEHRITASAVCDVFDASAMCTTDCLVIEPIAAVE